MMSSPTKIGAAQIGYYLELSREDYYLKGGEPLGRWWGKGADGLGLSGIVERNELKATLLGYGEDGRKLVQNAGKENRQCAWDLTFNAPKPVSTLWSQGDESMRRAIQEAHLEAVKAALSYFEEEFLLTRRGQGGREHGMAGLAFALFEHGTSREMDPHLHTHALMMNLGVREGGTCGAILSKPFFDHKMVAGALYRAELASQLEARLGVHCIREGKFAFSIEGVSKELNEEFSKRRQAIMDRLQSYGSESAAAAAAATLASRSKKLDAPPRSELFELWREVGRAFGFHAEDVIGQAKRPADSAKEFKKAVDAALECITACESHFTKKDLMEQVAIEAQGRCLSAKFIRAHVQDALEHSKNIRSLGVWMGQERFTTQSVLDAEKKLIDSADLLKANFRGHGSSTSMINKAILDSERKLSPDQREAIWQITGKGSGIRSLEGLAGTGKTSTLMVAKEALEKAGYRVIGAAVSGKAAKELEQGAGIESCTLASLQLKMKPSLEDEAIHLGKQLARAALNKPTFKLDRFKLDAKTVLVLDEAAMISTKELSFLVSEAAKSGAMLITAFDRKQLQAIGPGGGAAFLADRHGKASLNTIIRQHDEQDVANVRSFAHGKAEEALKSIVAKGDIHIGRNRESAIRKLVSDWAVDMKDKRKDSLIFAGTRDDVEKLNERCQQARLQSAEIGGEAFSGHGLTLFKGDRVLFTKNSRALDVQNGSLGTVIDLKLDQKIAVVRVDKGPTVQIPLKTYQSLQLGYAVTTHKGQGTTVDHAYVLAGGSMQDRELSYVQASRARESTRFYTDRHEAGEELSQLAKQMNKSNQKILAHEVMKQAEIEQQVFQMKLEHRL